ncbi:hypothetical protein IFM58399_02817 [Aspergillus lentulus]|nr:uncharacterized protein IFM58399_02817 [Aspergillus lentulus]GFF31224.1 hypothetical protein IFM58399_02817 [Aspergillus lentulus]GFF82169.1 hypothetical protein IFM60648_06266 [Aspergillus lentulus]GFF85978.1 hypothetical protein IFM47457_07001 [Aspergillus lentulus]GFG06197.1 hypothetical protein IFM61392_04220 [Aspergillus lentulus]
MELYGKFAPAGTEVSGNQWIMQRDKQMYGEDAEESKLERWLGAEKAKLYNKYSFTFDYGARVCLGKDIAMMELYKGPLQFFRRFNVQTVSDKPQTRFVIQEVLVSIAIYGWQLIVAFQKKALSDTTTDQQKLG